MKSAIVLTALALLGLTSATSFAVDNPGGFAEYYCGNLFPEHFIGAPASASGDLKALEVCAGRFALSEAVLTYGTDVKFQGLQKTLPTDDKNIRAYIFNVRTPDGKSHPFYTQVQTDSSHKATDGYDAIIVQLTPLGVCEGTGIDACG